MGELTYLDQGNDSIVYRSEDHVIKVYDRLMEKIGTDDTLRVLKQYHKDTSRAREMFNTTSIRPFRLGPNHYKTIVSIIPQGDISIASTILADRLPSITFDNYVIASGQRFIGGMSYKAIDYGYDHNIGESVFYDDINTFTSSMESSLDQIQEVLQKNLNVKFEMDPYNIKPSLDKDRHTIELVITDLAGNITTTYSNHT